MDEFAGKVAVITGGASGIGLATARALAREGARLVLADIELQALQAAVESLRSAGAEVVGVCTDVADRKSVEALANQAWARFGAVNILFNNAGVTVFGETQAMTHEDWKWTLDVNLWGAIHGVEAFVPRMLAEGQPGHVLFTASFAGLVSNRALGPYCVSKAAVVALAECLAKDIRSSGIGVSVLCPMRVETQIDDSWRNRPAELGGPVPQVYADKQTGTLEGRTLPVEAVADLVLDGVRRNSLYLLTHREAEPFIQRRFERLKDAAAHAL